MIELEVINGLDGSQARDLDRAINGNMKGVICRPLQEQLITRSNESEGHISRMGDHTMRIQYHPCQCGSGKYYGNCCMKKR